MADQNNERDIFGPSETKPGSSGQLSDSELGATGIDRDVVDEEWGHTHDMGTNMYNEPAMTGQQHQGEAQSTAEQVRQKAAPVVDQTKQKASQAMDEVQGRAYGMLDQQKSRAADTLGSVAGALHSTGDQLNQQNQGNFGQYAHRAADTIDNLSRQLNDKNIDELVHEAQDFARREPQIFLGGAVLAGILLARFLKSSAPEPDYGSSYYRQGYASGSQGQYGRSFERGGYGQGYTRRERGGIEQMDQDYNESWTGEDYYPPSSPGPIS